uniref:Uncharacterized protein n=1 Tax=Anguilla anguilla TaxID=7936 RepID=A0A0E9T997_ANGAN
MYLHYITLHYRHLADALYPERLTQLFYIRPLYVN